LWDGNSVFWLKIISQNKKREVFTPLMKPDGLVSPYIKRSKRSFSALQMGHNSGGSSRAQRYPHTLQRHTGWESLLLSISTVDFSAIFFFTSGGGLLSGMEPMFFWPRETPWETYSPQ
jgi:hypothetical protein